MLGVHTVAADWLKLRVVMQSLLAAAEQPRWAASRKGRIVLVFPSGLRFFNRSLPIVHQTLNLIKIR